MATEMVRVYGLEILREALAREIAEVEGYASEQAQKAPRKGKGKAAGGQEGGEA
jgi:hypothetical protein